MAASYEEAVHALNTLQSNAVVLDSIRATGDAHRYRSLPDTLKAANHIGVTIESIDKLSVIHVSGTKGKGSSCAFTESILRANGFKTGFYSSPHLIEVRERIRINGRPLSRDDFSRYFWHCYRLLESTKDQRSGAMPPYFRFLTVMAFHVFIEEKVDVAILEVGIGGEYDCTNIVRYPVVCGVTSLGLDHTSILGNTIDQIAWHKAGIFKNGVAAFTVPQPEIAMKVLIDRAAEIQCPLYVTPRLDQYAWNNRKIELGIPGNYQLYNASLALQLSNYWLNNHEKAVDDRRQPAFSDGIKSAAGFEITPNMTSGLKSCIWPGRSQKIVGPDITYYLDGAHTDNSIQLCAEWFNAETAVEEAEVGGPVVRVLLFNSTGDRKPEVLLTGLLNCKFDCAVFCPNIQRLSEKQSADLMYSKTAHELQMKRCVDNCNAWISLLTDNRQQHTSTFDPLLCKDSPVLSSEPSANNNDCKSPVPTRLFSCIVDSLFWISRGSELKLQSDTGFSLSDLPDCLRAAKRVFVLCTGSVHLVGDILSLLDPDACEK